MIPDLLKLLLGDVGRSREESLQEAHRWNSKPQLGYMLLESRFKGEEITSLRGQSLQPEGRTSVIKVFIFSVAGIFVGTSNKSPSETSPETDDIWGNQKKTFKKVVEHKGKVYRNTKTLFPIREGSRTAQRSSTDVSVKFH